MANGTGQTQNIQAVVSTTIKIIIFVAGAFALWFGMQSKVNATDVLAKENKQSIVSDRVRIVNNEKSLIGLKKDMKYVNESLKEQKVALEKYVEKQKTSTTQIIDAILALKQH